MGRPEAKPRQERSSGERLVKLARLALLGIPGLAVAVTAAVLLGPGAASAVVGARLWGVAGADRELALRVETLRRESRVDDASPEAALVVEALEGPGGAALARWEGATNAAGIGEARLLLPGPAPAEAWVRVARRGEVLAEGRLSAGPSPGAASGAERVMAPRLRGTRSGELELEVTVERGVVAAPFTTEVSARAGGKDAGATLSSCEARASGAEVVSAEARGERCALRLRPSFHRIELAVSAGDARGRRGRWEGELPVAPGAIWLDPSSHAGRLRLVSPAPRPFAYVSVFCGARRVLGAVVPLAATPEGVHAGAFDPPAGLDAGSPGCFLSVVVAGDPYEQGAGTVAWPLVPSSGAPSPPRIELLLDGLPERARLEAEKAARARRAALFAVASGALAEILLLLAHNRRMARRIERHLAEASSGPGVSDEARQALLASSREPILRVLLALALVAFAFALVAAIATLGG